MRRLGSTVASLALLGALMACDASASAAAGEVAPDWPAPPPGAQVLPSAQIDSSALPPGYPRLVWTEGDGGRVGLYGQEGGCTHAHADLREQTPRLVRVALVEVTPRSGPCTMDLRFPQLTVQFDAPLGDRTVVLERQTFGSLLPGR